LILRITSDPPAPTLAALNQPHSTWKAFGYAGASNDILARVYDESSPYPLGSDGATQVIEITDSPDEQGFVSRSVISDDGGIGKRLPVLDIRLKTLLVCLFGSDLLLS